MKTLSSVLHTAPQSWRSRPKLGPADSCSTPSSAHSQKHSITNLRKCHRADLERWLRSSEFLLLIQRTRVLFLAPPSVILHLWMKCSSNFLCDIFFCYRLGPMEVSLVLVYVSLALHSSGYGSHLMGVIMDVSNSKDTKRKIWKHSGSSD